MFVSSRQVDVSQRWIASLIVTSLRPSLLNAAKLTPNAPMNVPPAPVNDCTSRPVVTSQTLTALLPPEAASKRLSGLHAKTGDRLDVLVPPFERLRSSRPVAVSHNLIVFVLNVAVASSRPSGLNPRRVAP